MWEFPFFLSTELDLLEFYFDLLVPKNNERCTFFVLLGEKGRSDALALVVGELMIGIFVVR